MSFLDSSVPAFGTKAILQPSQLLMPYQHPDDGSHYCDDQHQRNDDHHSTKRFARVVLERVCVDSFYRQRDRRRSDFKNQRFYSGHSFGGALYSLTFGERTHASRDRNYPVVDLQA
jgi:hypothetical protein